MRIHADPAAIVAAVQKRPPGSGWPVFCRRR